jgi:hypothetical protein
MRKRMTHRGDQLRTTRDSCGVARAAPLPPFAPCGVAFCVADAPEVRGLALPPVRFYLPYIVYSTHVGGMLVTDCGGGTPATVQQVAACMHACIAHAGSQEPGITSSAPPGSDPNVGMRCAPTRGADASQQPLAALAREDGHAARGLQRDERVALLAVDQPLVEEV